jgi:hypothetical protein
VNPNPNPFAWEKCMHPQSMPKSVDTHEAMVSATLVYRDAPIASEMLAKSYRMDCFTGSDFLKL